MRHLLGGIAAAALLAAGLPAAAQMSNTAHQPPLLSNPPAPRAPKAAPAQSAQAQSGTSTTAQNGPDTAQQPAPSSAQPEPSAKNGGMEGQSTPPTHHMHAKTGKAAPGKHVAKGATHRRVAQNRAQDNMAEQLNQQELQRVEQGSSTSSSGSTAPAGSSSGPASGNSAPQQ